MAFAKEYYHCDYKELLQKFREHLHISDNIPTEKVTNTESKKTATTDTHIDDRRIYITAERPIQAGFIKAYIQYGITFIDHAAKTVFNGSDLGKDYTAKRILERLGESGRMERSFQKGTEEKIGNILSDLDYSKGIQGTLKQLYEKGLRLDTIKEENNSASYFLSHTGDEKRHSISAGKKLSAYFQANGVTNDHCEKLNEYIESNGTDLLQSYLEGLFAQQYVASSGRITPGKKKIKRKVNW